MTGIISAATRRNFLIGMASALALAACGNGVGSDRGAQIDQQVDQTLDFMVTKYPGTQKLLDDSSGYLVIPVTSEAAFGVGVSGGEGALRIQGQTVDYYTTAAASVGFQIGAQQYSHVLFFMTDEALTQFRTGAGWEAGGNLQYAFNDQGQTLNATSNSLTEPIIVAIFGQAGLIAGANIEGTKYTRVIR